MAHKDMTVVRTGRYGTRMLTAGEAINLDGPQARLMTALGWVEEGKPRRAKPAGEDIAVVRAEYEAKMGKRPFNGWDIATLREKMAE